MFWPAPRPPRQSLPDGPSTVFCVAVVAWTVVISPSMMVYSSWMILARGARQLVVHDAFDRTLMSLVYLVWLTPITNIGASADGAEMITFFAPPCRCIDAFSITVKIPVDSQTISAPASAPRHLVRVADGVELDHVAVDRQRRLRLVVLDRALVLAVGRVVLEEVRRVFDVAERVVDRLDAGAVLLARRAAHEATDAAEAGDTEVGRHF